VSGDGGGRFAEDYVDVAERIRTFHDRYPDGTLQPADPAHPVELLRIGDDVFLVFTAAAYRTPDDPRPGMGTAWEAYPGRTPYTRGSELQNAETSAWGRAIASLGIATRRGIATAQDVDAARRWNRVEDTGPGDDLVARIGAGMRAAGMDAAGAAAFITDRLGSAVPTRAMTREQAETVAAALDQLQPVDVPEAADLVGLPEAEGEPDGDGLATSAQLRMLSALARQAGLTERAEIIDLVAALAGRPVVSRKELTRAEASVVIDHLVGVVGPVEQDTAPAGVPPDGQEAG
jgi:hypothetical protein